jgi:hypothetical protein
MQRCAHDVAIVWLWIVGGADDASACHSELVRRTVRPDGGLIAIVDDLP